MTNDSLFYAAALLLTDRPFLVENHEVVEADDFPDGPLRELIRYGLHHWAEYGEVLTEDTLRGYLEHVDEDDAEELWEAYAICVRVARDPAALPLLREKGKDWLKGRWVGRAIDEASQALKIGDKGGAIQALQKAERRSEHQPTRELRLDTSLGEVLARPVTEDYVPTGVDSLDEVLAGGLRPAEFGIILGHTNVGKSMVTSMFAAQAYLSNKRVLYYTSELTVDQVVQRTAAAVFKQPIDALTDPVLYTQALAHIRRLAELDRAAITVRELPLNFRSVCRELDELDKEDETPDLLVFDTIDDLEPEHKSENTYTSLGRLYSGCRVDLAQRRNLTIWTSTQTHRDAVDKAKISLKNVGDSFIKVQRAHVVLGMAQTDAEFNGPWGPVMRLVVLKDTLHGAKGKGWRFNAKFGPKDKCDGYPGLEEADE